MSPARSGGRIWTVALVVLVLGSGALMVQRFARSLGKKEPFEPFERMARGAVRPEDPAPPLAFRLVDQNGAAVSEASLADKVWIADFIFTHCAGPCPAMSSAMQRLREQLAGEPGLAFVSFSVDPERDTPEVLAAYATRYGESDPRWRLLTGDRAQIARLARECFRLDVKLPGAEEDPNAILHSTRFVLVGRGLAIRATYPFDPDSADAPAPAAHPDEAMRALVADARALLAR